MWDLFLILLVIWNLGIVISSSVDQAVGSSSSLFLGRLERHNSGVEFVSRFDLYSGYCD